MRWHSHKELFFFILRNHPYAEGPRLAQVKQEFCATSGLHLGQGTLPDHVLANSIVNFLLRASPMPA